MTREKTKTYGCFGTWSLETLKAQSHIIVNEFGQRFVIMPPAIREKYCSKREEYEILLNEKIKKKDIRELLHDIKTVKQFDEVKRHYYEIFEDIRGKNNYLLKE